MVDDRAHFNFSLKTVILHWNRLSGREAGSVEGGGSRHSGQRGSGMCGQGEMLGVTSSRMWLYKRVKTL